MITLKYFAYGSNMSKSRMIKRGLPISNRQTGILEDYKFIINKKSYKNPNIGFANIIPSNKDVVEGILYDVTEEDIKKLDKFEGYPKHYDKKILTIKLSTGDLTHAIVYVAKDDWVSETTLNSTIDYKNFILEGVNFLSAKYFYFLKENIKTN